MIEPSGLKINQLKTVGKLFVDIKPVFYFVLLFFLIAGVFCIEQSIALDLDWTETILAFSIPTLLAGWFGYYFICEGLFCFAATEDHWYFLDKENNVLMSVPWSDCYGVEKESQSSGDGSDIVFSIKKDAVKIVINPKNASVSTEEDTVNISFSGFIIFQKKKVRELKKLHSASVEKI